MAELKCKKCGAILNNDNCYELYHLRVNNIDVDNSTELMCNDCAFREDARKHVQEFICDDESLKLDERMFISLQRVLNKYNVKEIWRDYLNKVYASYKGYEGPIDYEEDDNVDLFISNNVGEASEKIDDLASYYYGDNWELDPQFREWFCRYFGGYWVEDFEDDYD